MKTETNINKSIDPIDLDAYFKNNPNISESAFYIRNRYGYPKVIQVSVLAAMHYIFSKINEKDAETFLHEVITGEFINKKTPSYLLREKLLQYKIKRSRPTETTIFIAFFKAWNYWRKKETPTYFKDNDKTKLIYPI